MTTKTTDYQEFRHMDEQGRFYLSKIATTKAKIAEVKASPYKCLVEEGKKGTMVLRVCYNTPYQPQKLGLVRRWEWVR